MIWKFGDNINTDFITPGRYNLTTREDELAKITFIEYRPEFSKEVKAGDFVVAGENFGCGSSRETAAVALKACGVRAVFAKSFARIFYRNAINIGLFVIIVDTSNIDEGDELVLDLDRNILKNNTKNLELNFDADPIMKKIVAEGGIIQYLQKNGLESIARL